MKRKFFTNLLLLLTVNVLIKPIWLFGIDRNVQIVTGDDFGIYYSLLGLSATLNILLDLGITNYNNRNIACYRHLLPKHLGNILGIKLVLAFAYAIICFVWASIVGYDDLQFHILAFLVVNQFLLSLILYLRSNLAALHLFTIDSLVSVLDRVFMILLCGILLFANVAGGNFRIEWFVYVQSVSYAIAAIIILMIVLKKAGKISLRFNFKFSLVFLRKTYPYAILILLMAFYNRFDVVLLERLLPGQLGDRQVSIYAHGFRLLDAAAMFGVLFAGMLLPIFSRMIKKKEKINDMVKFSFSLIIFLSLTISVSCFFYRVEIMEWMKYDHVAASAPVFATLMFGFIPIATTYIFGTLLTANGSLRQLNIMAAFGMVLNITLNLILIPKFYAQGAAFSSLLTQFLTSLAQVIIAVRIFKFTPKPGIYIRVFLFAGLLFVSGYFSRFIDSRLLGFVVTLVVSTGVAFLIGLINLRALLDILMNRD